VKAVQGIVYDSRQVKPDYLFVAMPGQHRDGVTFIDEALRRGAVAIVSECGFARQAVPHLQVTDARLALAQLAASFYGHPDQHLKVFGITGTNGKTTTAFLIRSILNAVGQRSGLISTVRYEIGERSIPAIRTTPEAPDLQKLLNDMVRSGSDSVVMEVSSHALAQHRVAAMAFDVAIFTNLSIDHLDYHGNVDRYFEAKCRLFEQLKPSKGIGVINVDDARGAQLMRDDFLSYGLSPQAAVRACDVVMTDAGSSFRVQTPWGEAAVHVPLLGRFNVHNALAALAACAAQGIPLQSIVSALSREVEVPGRLQSVPTTRPFRVFVDYAHTEDALRSVLEILREITSGRVMLVFGCGGDRDTSKRAAMGRVAAEAADYTWITNDNPRSEDPMRIAAMIQEGFGDAAHYRVCLDRAHAIGEAIQMAQAGDSVLIAGKGHETYQEAGMTRTPFDDAAVAAAALQEWTAQS
jgi:UDP-N-acetylmuramoyl-L-alanyl-D-glutamate--2,6-diaminopimelate ligase